MISIDIRVSCLASLTKIWNTLFSFYYFLLGKCIQVVFKYALFMKLYLEFIYLDATYFISQAKSHLLSPAIFIIFSSIILSRDHELIIPFLSIWFMIFILSRQCTCCHVGLVDCDSWVFWQDTYIIKLLKISPNTT